MKILLLMTSFAYLQLIQIESLAQMLATKLGIMFITILNLAFYLYWVVESHVDILEGLTMFRDLLVARLQRSQVQSVRSFGAVIKILAPFIVFLGWTVITGILLQMFLRAIFASI
ncbi:MAG: hypothetical protein B6U95_00310 [Thermofilum sp. ex4484_82]|nr:MAG: hypothetical protein B6U95_00310 [Thermofilum sp. ex4484_82]OYT40057.1 MAG: hypothetical protein B6U96_00310 [Archaeoglobales archaeon ex4484_92]